jgi:hypothetical protein
MLNHVSLRGTVVHKPPSLRLFPSTNVVGMYVKCNYNVEDVVRCLPAPFTRFDIPYLDYKGRPTRHVLVRLSGDPLLIISSLICTAYTRLSTFARKHNTTFDVVKRLDLIAAIVAYQIVSGDAYHYSRFLSLIKIGVRSQEQTICKLLRYVVSRLPVYTRGLYIRLWKRSYWFSFRGRSRNNSVPRDNHGRFQNLFPGDFCSLDIGLTVQAYDVVWGIVCRLASGSPFLSKEILDDQCIA